MASFIDVIRELRDIALTLPNVTTVTFGSPYEIDLKRQSLYPLMHIVPTPSTFEGAVNQWRFDITLMDMIDWNKDDLNSFGDPFIGQSNEMFVLANTAQQLQIFIDKLSRSETFGRIQAERSVPAEPFVDDTENSCAGWTISVVITATSATVTDGIC